MANDDIDLDLGDEDQDEEDLSLDSDDGQQSDDKDVYRRVLDVCGGPDLLEVFGESGSAKSAFAIEVMKKATNTHGEDVLFIDTERNVGDVEDLEGADYVYIPEWHDIYNYIVGRESQLSDNAFGKNTTNSRTLTHDYDVVVLDSIGFPALVQYSKYRVADDAEQFKVFNELQAITGELKQYSQRNQALVFVINQPKSELSGEKDPKPFGDKSIYGYKEIWKTEKISSHEAETNCEINTYRSRQAGSGKTLFDVTIDGSGVEINYLGDDETGGWV